MNKHNSYDLAQMQSLPLKAKILMTRQRIKAWYEHWDGKVYVSFSGGKDSTVLLDIVRNVCGYTDVPAVFVDTGLEYPEIREFVKQFDNVIWLKPEMNFRKVIETYGYPVVSKEVSQMVYECQDSVRRGKPMPAYREQKLRGTFIDKKTGKLSKYNAAKWGFLLDAPFKISHKCCNVMKKNPAKKYEKESGRKRITAMMATESRLREQQWIRHGCNAFDTKRPISNPMSFWTEQDVLQYIKQNDLPICSVYGDIVHDISGTDEVEGQYEMSDCFGEEARDFNAAELPLKTTGCNRTGCMFCGFGMQIEDDDRFERMSVTHPKQWEWIMKPWKEGGLGFKDVINFMNEHGKLNIKIGGKDNGRRDD